MEACIFCKIASEEIPSPRLYEDEKVFAIADIRPSYETHLLFIPHLHISGLDQLGEHEGIAQDITKAIVKYTKENKILSYRVVVNVGKGFQEVPHLHYHLLAGKPKS